MKGFNASMAASNDEVSGAGATNRDQSAAANGNNNDNESNNQQAQYQQLPSQQRNVMDEMMQQDLQMLASEAPLDGGESTFGGAYSQLGGSRAGELATRTPTPADLGGGGGGLGLPMEPPSDFREQSEGGFDGAGDMIAAQRMVSLEQLAPDNVNGHRAADSNGGGGGAGAPDGHDDTIARAPPAQTGFLVSFMVDARGGTMRGCRHSGVRVIIPPGAAQQPTRITCRYLRRERLVHPPPLMEGEACASKIMEVGPAGARFLNNVLIEVPHFASLRGKEREIIILRSDSGEVWREHTVDSNAQQVIDNLLNEADSYPTNDGNPNYYGNYQYYSADEATDSKENVRPASRISASLERSQRSTLESQQQQQQQQQSGEQRLTRIVTTEFPQYFAIISRIKQDVHAIGPDGASVSASNAPKVQAIFTEGALTKRIKIGLQPKKSDENQQQTNDNNKQLQASATSNQDDAHNSMLAGDTDRPASAASHTSASGANSNNNNNNRPSSRRRRRRFLACFGAKNGSADNVLDDRASSDSSQSQREPCNELPVQKRHIIGDISDSESIADSQSTSRPKSVPRRTSHLVPDDYYIEREAPLILNGEPATYGKRLASSAVQTDAKLQNGSMTTRVGKSRRKRNVLLRGPKRNRKTQLTIKCIEPPATSGSGGGGTANNNAPAQATTSDAATATDSSLESTALNATAADSDAARFSSASPNVANDSADETSSLIRDVFMRSDDLKRRTCLIQTDSDSVTVNYVTICGPDAEAFLASEAAAASKTADASTATSGAVGDDGYVSGSGDLQRPHSSSFGKGLFGACGSANAASDGDEASESSLSTATATKRTKRVKKQLAPEAGPATADEPSADEAAAQADASKAAASAQVDAAKAADAKADKAEQKRALKRQKREQAEQERRDKQQRKEAKKAEKEALKLQQKQQKQQQRSSSPEQPTSGGSVAAPAEDESAATATIGTASRGVSVAKEVTFAMDSAPTSSTIESSEALPTASAASQLEPSAPIASELNEPQQVTSESAVETVTTSSISGEPRPILKQPSLSVSTPDDEPEEEEIAAEVVISSEHKLQRKMSSQPVELGVASDDAVRLADSLKAAAKQTATAQTDTSEALDSKVSSLVGELSAADLKKKAKEEKERIKREAKEREKEAKAAAKQAKEAKKAAEAEAKRVAKAAKEAEKLAAKKKSPETSPEQTETKLSDEKVEEVVSSAPEATSTLAAPEASALDDDERVAKVDDKESKDDASSRSKLDKSEEAKKSKKEAKKSKAKKSEKPKEKPCNESQSSASIFGRLFRGKSAPKMRATTDESDQSKPSAATGSQKAVDEHAIVSEMYSSDPNDANAELILEVNVPKELIEPKQASSSADSSAQQVTSSSTIVSSSTLMDDKTSAAIEPLQSSAVQQVGTATGQRHSVEDAEDDATLVNISQMIASDLDDATENIVSQSETIDAFPVASETQATSTKHSSGEQTSAPPERVVADELVNEALESAASEIAKTERTEEPKVSDEQPQASASSLADEKNRRKLEAKLAKEAKKRAAEEAKAEKKRLKLEQKEAKKREKEEKKRLETEAKQAKIEAKKLKKEQAKEEKSKKAKKAKTEAEESVTATTAAAAATVASTSEPAVCLDESSPAKEPQANASVVDEQQVERSEMPANVDDNATTVLATSDAVPVSEETQVERIVEEHIEEDGTVTKRTKTVETKLVTMRQEELRVAEKREIPVEEWQREELSRMSRRSSVSSAGGDTKVQVTLVKEEESPVEQSTAATVASAELAAIKATPSYFDPSRVPDEILKSVRSPDEINSMPAKKLEKKRVKLNEKLIKRAKKLAKFESKRAKTEANKAKNEIAVCDEAARNAQKQLRRALKESKRASKLAAKEHKRMDKIDKKLAKRQKKLDKRQRKLDKRAAKIAKKFAKKQQKEAQKESKKAAKVSKSQSSSSTQSSGSLKRSQSGSKKSIKIEDIGEPILRSSSRLSVGASTSAAAAGAAVAATVAESSQVPSQVRVETSGDELVQVSLDLDGKIVGQVNENGANALADEIEVDVVGDGDESLLPVAPEAPSESLEQKAN